MEIIRLKHAVMEIQNSMFPTVESREQKKVPINK